MAAQNLGGYDRTKELKEFDESKVGVKGLVDSGITSIPRIFVHPLEESLFNVAKVSDDHELRTSISIPVIDILGIESPSARPRIIDQVKTAAKMLGFFQVVNHGIPLSVQDDTISAIKAFHELPGGAKSQYYHRLGGGSKFKYISNNDLYESNAASWRDTVQVVAAPEIPPPESLPEVLQREVGEWITIATGVAAALVEVLSEALGLERGRLGELALLASRVFLGHYYPYCPEPDRTVGITTHTDASVLTVLKQSRLPGLQVMSEQGVWVDVKPQPEALIVNIGDLFQVLSNGEYKSAQHRVLANSCKEPRISAVMFFFGDKLKGGGFYGPLPELVSPEKPAMYRNFTVEEFLQPFAKEALGNNTLVGRFKI